MLTVETLVERTREALTRRPRPPESTYRVQFHKGFTFQDGARLAAYLRQLGVTHLYASPYLKARPGSTHGYDIIDHSALNPEIGSEDDHRAMVAALGEHDLGQILDIVPNHMGVATNDNPWWNDVLENGPASRFGGYFDIAWRASPRPELQDKVLLPVLGEPYGDVLEAGQLRLFRENGAFFLAYFDRRFPIAPKSSGRILSHRLEELQRLLPQDAPALLEYESILTAARNLPGRSETEPARVAERQREKEVIKRRLATLLAENETVRTFVDENVAHFNGTPGNPRSFDLLDDLLNDQCYRLSYWRVASDEINYRRFFDINDLAALSMERLDVFEAAHAVILRLLADGTLDGLRIDHPDGLYDPRQYFERLHEHYILAVARRHFENDPERGETTWAEIEPQVREHLAPLRDDKSRPGRWPVYVVVEKILALDERLPDDWAVAGTSGYDFLNVANGLFVDSRSADALTRLYNDWTQESARFSELVFRKKLLILQMSLTSELHMLTHQLDRLAQKTRRSRDMTFNTLRDALERVIACFPVYRAYVSDHGLHDSDRRHVEIAVRRAQARTPLMSRAVFRFIRGMLLLESPESFTEEDKAEQRRFAGKFQQVTAPVTAKGIEDTAFYVYNRLVSLNEVGGDPGRVGLLPEVVHRLNAERQARWPCGLSPLSTHDTKRSEDVRARINVLSEIPELWRSHVTRWRQLNERHRKTLEDASAPDPQEEYLLYQTLVGAWPLESGDEASAEFVQRIQAYMQKALHEAKVHTSWINPDAEYDAAVQEFVARVLDEQDSEEFLADFRAFQQRVSHYGLLNSLSQTLFRLSAPGIPDTYQGTELWDFSLVDPDNRRPVDYARRQEMLDALQRQAARADRNLARFAGELLASKEDGRIKMYLTWRGLECRRECPGLFSSGEYIPLRVDGEKADHLFAFARRLGEQTAIAVIPRLFATLVPETDRLPLGEAVWRDTRIVLPETLSPGPWQDIFTRRRHFPSDGLAVSGLLSHLPFALLVP